MADFIFPEDERPKVNPAAGFVFPPAETDQQAAANAREAVTVDPDKFAKSRALAARAGLPTPTVERNQDDVEAQQKALALQDLMARNPVFARQMRDPDFAKLSHDDTQNLVDVDKIVASRGPAAGVGSVALGLLKALPQGFEATRQGIRQQFADLFGFKDMSADAARKGARVAHETALSTPEIKDDTLRGVYSGLTSVVQQAPGLAASVLTMNPVPALATAGVQAEAQAYTKYKDRGASPVMAGLGALGEGGTEVLTEMLPMGFLVKKLGKVNAGEFLTGLLAREVPSEQVATLVQDAIDTAIANPDKTWAQYAVERPAAAYQTLVATVTQAGVMAGTGAAVKRLANPQPDLANAHAEATEQLLKLAEASKVRERDASKFEAYVNDAAQDGPVQNIHVSAATFAQAAGEKLPEIIATMPSVGAQLQEALATGGDLVIPLGEFAAHVPGTGLEQSLIDHIRTAPDAMTREEAQVFMQSGVEEAKAHAEKILAEHVVEDGFKQSAAKVEATLLAELEKANRFTADVNKPYAQLAASFYTVQAARLGITPEEMYVRFPLKVQAASVAGQRVMDQPAKTNTPQFKKWFDKSKAVAADGRPLVVFHGSTASIEKFEGGKTDLGAFFFTADHNYAASHVAQMAGSDSGYLNPTYLSMQNPKVVVASDNEFSYRDFERAQIASAKAEGHDGVVFQGPKRTFYAVFKPAQVKSYNNAGAFDSSSDNVFDQQARGQISFADDITKNPSVITLLQNADLSTFVHELGHFQLEVLAHISSQPNAPAEIVADMNALLSWFTVKDLATWNVMSLEEKRPYHEQLARGFESYIFEGNAPSQELHGVFARMRAWMINVYKNLQALNVTLTDEVRQVFNRLIATNEQITTMEAARGYAPLFKSAEEMGATPAEWKAYQEQNVDQTQEAVDELQTRSLRNMKWLANARSKVVKDLQKQGAAARKAVEAEVTDEVRAQPIYAVQRFLRYGELPDTDRTNAERKLLDSAAGMKNKLDLAVLKEMYGEDPAAPWRYLPTGQAGMVASEDGLHPDTVAQLFGFTSGDHLVREILAAQPEAVEIEGKTDQRMLERYGDLTDAQSIERAADAAIHNEVRAKFIASELRALAKATGQKNILVKAAKAFAEAIIARKLVRDVKPAQYSAAEARAGRAAEKAKSLVEKATEKRNQLVSHYAARAAYDAIEDVQKAVEYLKRLDGAAARKAISPDYMDQIDQMLERFDLRTGQSLKSIDKRTALADWIKAQEALGFEPTIDDALRNEAFRKSFKDMTVEEVRGLVDAVKNIEHLGRLKNKLLTAKDQREFDAVVADIAATIAANAKKSLPEQRASDRGFLVKAASLFRYAAAIHRKFASLVRGFDGFKDGGVAWERLVRVMNERGNFEAVENEKATVALSKLLSPVMKAGKLTQKQYFADIGKSFSREERIGIALNMGNEVNRERVITGERLMPAQLEKILDTLTKEDWQFVQGVWDYFESFRPQIAAKERRVTGTEPEWVEAAPVQTKHGTFKGGYYPIAYDPVRSERSNADVNAEVQRQIQQGLYTRAQTRRGHTKARVESTGRPLRYDFGEVITRHVTQVIHDLAWHEYLIDANRLLRAGAIENAVREHYGVEVLAELKDTLKDIAIGSTAAEKGATFWNHLRYGTTIAGLAYNAFNTLQNLTGITQSMSRIGSKWVFKGAAHWAGDAARFEGSVKQIHEKSEFMRLRAKTMLREINEIRNKVSGNDSKLQASYFYLQQRTQLVVDVPTWWGAYEKAMSQDKMSEDKAVALADQAVIDAQGSGQIKDLAGIQRGGAGMKLFTTFYSFFNTTLNLTAEAAGRTDFKKPGEVALFAADMVLLYTLPALLTTLMKAALAGDWDDEEKLAKKVIGDQISYLMGTVVGLREASAGVQAATGTGEGFGYTGPASVRFFADLYKLGQQAQQGEADEAFWKSLDNVGGVLFHYPAGQINRTATGIAALTDGRTQNPFALMMGAPHK